LFSDGFKLDSFGGLVGKAMKDQNPWDDENNWNLDNTTNDKSFLDQVKDTYSSAKDGASGFFKEVGDSMDPRVYSAAKDIAKTAVRNIMNGQPTDFGSLAKQQAAPQIGRIAGSVFDDPDMKRSANQAAQTIIYGQDKRLTNIGKDVAIKQIFDIIGK
jgi:hypothetical protein